MTNPYASEPTGGIRSTRFARRTLLRGGIAVAGAGALAACGAKGTAEQAGGAASASAVEDLSDSEKKLVVSNWPEYIDQNDKQTASPSLQRFEKESGVAVTYQIDINDNNSFFGKVQPQLQNGQSIGRDLVVLTDWMAARWIQGGWAQKLDKANIPNAANLRQQLASPGFDPDRDYTLPWQSGLTGIAYSTKRLKRPVTSIDQLLTDPALKGKVTVLQELNDTIGLILLDMGKDPADFSKDDFDAAVKKLADAVDSGQIRQVTGNDYLTALGQGSISAAIAWSGDILGEDTVEFVVPDSGVLIWSDNMLVPPLARHKKNAEEFMNFYYAPENAAMVTAWVNYVSPVDGVQPLVRKIDPEVAGDPLVFPSAKTLAETHVFADLDETTRQQYTQAFQSAIGA